MSKRGGDSTRILVTKVKKRKGVGSRTITILDSDEEDLLPKVSTEYARVTKTRVTASGKAERITTSSIPVFEVEDVNDHAPPEVDNDNLVDDATENVISVAPAKKRKRVNDSVSDLTPHPHRLSKNPLDQDALLA